MALGRSDLPFHRLQPSEANQHPQEAANVDLVESTGTDQLAIGMYRQILNPAFWERFASRVINIHLSFMFAFADVRPYHQGSDRMVEVVNVAGH